MGTELYQPILTKTPEPGHAPSDALNFEQFLTLLREEEDYFSGEQNNTKLMVTRLRKIFYDQWGWNSELIRGAADIEMRYVVEIVDDNDLDESKRGLTKQVQRFQKIPKNSDKEYVPKHRVVTYRPDDKVYGNTRVGQIPEIYQKDHQEIVLPDGYYCDMGHVLAGLDAHNYKAPVTPLPGFLMFMYKLFPHVDNNIDIVTWLGDIASTSGDFMFEYLNNGKKPLTPDKEQEYINKDAPGSDMLGDIDPYVIYRKYNVGSNNGQRVSEIFEHYYTAPDSPRLNRYSIYAEAIGLSGWDGEKFATEQEWMKFYNKHLCNNVTFQVFSLTDQKIWSLWLPFVIWLGAYRSVLKMDTLLKIYLSSLKEAIKSESNRPLSL